MDNQRVRLTLLAAFLFTLVFFFFNQPKRAAKPPAGEPGGASESRNVDRGGGPIQQESDFFTAGAQDPNGGSGALQATEAPVVSIAPLENDYLRVELDCHGGSIGQIALKQYYGTAEEKNERPGDPSGWVRMLREPRPDAEVATFPVLALTAHGGSVDDARRMATNPWTVREETTGGVRTVVFSYSTGDGVELEKRLTLRPDRYAVDVVVASRKLAASPQNARLYKLRIASGVSDIKRGQLSNDPESVAMTLDARDNPSVTRRPGKSDEPKSIEVIEGQSRIAWAGVANHYFALLLEPADGDASRRSAGLRLETAEPKDKESAAAEITLSLPLDPSLGFKETRFNLFAGPKDPRLMEAQDFARFVPLIEEDYGSTFRWVNKGLLYGLRTFHGLVENWGVAIMLLTLLVRTLVFPITRAQQVSMARYAAKMAVLKPKLDRLKAEMGSDQQAFAKEQMKLLREHGATPPLFGCLSSFITLPVFVGMWQILRTAIEVRQAPFAGWITDLSLPDQLYTIPGIEININVLPILATTAFITQILIQPKPADPQAQQQQKIMLVMPIVFGVLFYSYAAGLSLYSLTSSALSIFETKVIRKKWPVATAGTPSGPGGAPGTSGGTASAPPPPPKPPAKRPPARKPPAQR